MYMATHKLRKNDEEIKAICFDLDNTIITTRESDIKTIHKVNVLTLTGVNIISWDNNIRIDPRSLTFFL